MRRNFRSYVAILASVLMTAQFSCTTTFGTAVRDAAIDGTAGFVEAATTDLLNQWFGAAVEDP